MCEKSMLILCAIPVGPMIRPRVKPRASWCVGFFGEPHAQGVQSVRLRIARPVSPFSDPRSTTFSLTAASIGNKSCSGCTS